MDLEPERWQRFEKWFDCHWRILILAIGTIVAAIVVAVLIHRLNETDARLKRAMCVEVAFLEKIPPRDSIPELVAGLRREVTCPVPPKLP